MGIKSCTDQIKTEQIKISRLGTAGNKTPKESLIAKFSISHVGVIMLKIGFIGFFFSLSQFLKYSHWKKGQNKDMEDAKEN